MEMGQKIIVIHPWYHVGRPHARSPPS